MCHRHPERHDRNGECRDAFLAVSCQSRCQVNSAGTFSAVKAPNGFRAGWIHVDGFTAIAPARRYRNGEAYILTAEFSSQAAASAIPAIQVSEMTHSTAAPQAWRSFSVSSAAVAFAIFIVCSSSDSRTPMRRPSITGRIPISVS